MGADPTGFMQCPPPTSTDGTPINPTSYSRPQTNPSFPVHPNSYWHHAPEIQPIPSHADPPVSLGRPPSPSTFPVHPRLGHFMSGPLHTPYSNFPAQYVMSTHPPPFPNQSSQPHVYHAYRPLEPTRFPPAQYFPLLAHQPRPYFSPPASAHSPYEQTRLPPPSLPQFATSNPGSSQGSYGDAQQYLPHLYSADNHFSPSQPYQHHYQWYLGPHPSVDMFVEGNPVQVQQHDPMNYPYPRPRKASGTQMAQPTGSEPLPNLPRSGSVPSDVSPPAGNPVPVQASPKVDPHQPNQKTAASNTRPHDRPAIRREYHPNPPPNRSRWVMWIGNIPRDATEDELWQFLSRPITTSSGSEGSSGVEDNGVISIFLISRSNCAFANYQSEAQLNRAISQFSGRKLRPHDRRCPRLVCRARRIEDDLRAGVGGQRGLGVHANYIKNVLQKGSESSSTCEESTGHRPEPSRTGGSQPVPLTSNDGETTKVEGTNSNAYAQSPSSHASTSSSLLACYFPKRFFILKSLSQIDLDLSTERGVWATQKHNESILDQAFRTSQEVILVFSVNKSGEFYGYGRMASGIFGGDYGVSWAPRTDPLPHTISPTTSRIPVHGLVEQFEPPHSSSSEHPSPSPFAPSKSQDYQSTANSSVADPFHDQPLALPPSNRDSEGPQNSDPTFRSGSMSSRQRWSQVRGAPLNPPSIPTFMPQSDKYPEVRARPGEDCSSEDLSHRGLCALPVVEEALNEDEPPHMGMRPGVIPGHRSGLGGDWGDTFKIEWLSTERVQFYRTRHLRNPWNRGREIKVSRDGTELEPSVGQELVDSWTTLACGDDTGRATHSVGRRSGRHPKPGSSPESKGVGEEPL